jgi:nitroreductase
MRISNFGGIMTNPVLKAIRDRRSIIRFKSTPIDDEKVKAVLEAGRWAPSWMNMQPWRFITVKDGGIKEQLSSIVPTFFNLSIKDASICIVVCVNPKEDPYHFIEDGTTATQNMALAAQSLGLGTSWIGVFSLDNERSSAERKLKEILAIPKDWRVISVLPLGAPKFKEHKTRKELSELLDFNYFRIREERKPNLEEMKKPPAEIHEIPEPVSARELEHAPI